jgi:RNA polymerase sigma-70 factor (ECF subfamily)
MARYATGDASSFNDVYRDIAPYLQKYLMRQTRDRALASDLFQQVLLQIHATRSRFVPGADIYAWAITIARHVLIDDIRRNRRRPEASLAESTDQPDRASAPDDTAHARSLGTLLQSHLAGLPEAQREAFELLKVEGLAVEDIAARLGTTANAAKLRAHRALVALRFLLASEMDNRDA